MKLSTKIAYNTLIQLASKIIATLAGLIIIAIITRYLGQIGFGEYTAAITFLSFFAIIADLGLTLVTVQLISRPDTDQERTLGNLLGLRLVTASILLGAAPLISLFMPYSAEAKEAIAIASLSFLFVAMNQILVGLFQKQLRMDKVAIAEIASRVLLLVGVGLVAHFDLGLIGVMVATVTSSFLSLALHLVFARSFTRLSLRFEWTVWKDIFILSWPLALTIALNLIYLKTDTLLLSVIERPSDIGIMNEVGIYGAAYKVIDIVVTFPFMFSGIVLPLLTRRWAAGEMQSFRDVVQKAFDVMVIFCLPMIAGTILLADDMMVFVAGEEFALSGPVLKVLIFAAGMIFLGNIFAHALIAIEKQKKIIGAYFFVAVTSLAAYLFVIPRFSYFGAAYVTIYSESVIALASFLVLYHYTKIFPSLIVFSKSLAASILMYLSIIAMRDYAGFGLLSLIICGSISYFIFLLLFKGISREDLIDIIRRN